MSVNISEGFILSRTVWSVTIKTLLKHPRILAPFLVKAVFEGAVLTVLFYFPRPPFLSVFGPPIQRFFGAAYLHYPYNFKLLPDLFYYGQVFSMLTIGVVMYGMAISMADQAHTAAGEVRIFGSLNRALRRYLGLAGVWIITFIISLILLKATAFLLKFVPFSKPLFTTFSYVMAVAIYLIEALFIYSYAAIIIERRRLFSAIKRSFGIARQVFWAGAILVVTPRLLEFLFMFAKQKQTGLMNLTMPEITLVILAGGIVIIFIADSLVFLSTANLFILKKETEKEAQN